MQLAFDFPLEPLRPKLAKIIRFPEKPTGLTCSLCGTSKPDWRGSYPRQAGKGWKEHTNFHPTCDEDLRKYGTRGS